jgi:hypothetical protein
MREIVLRGLLFITILLLFLMSFSNVPLTTSLNQSPEPTAFDSSADYNYEAFFRVKHNNSAWGPYKRLTQTTNDTMQTLVASNAIYNPNYIVTVYKENYYGDYDWYFSKSTDGGSSWTASTLAVNTTYDLAGTFNHSAIAMDKNGTAHLLWNRYACQTPGIYTEPVGIYYANYNGISWSNPVTVYEEFETNVADRDNAYRSLDICIGKGNTIHVAYAATLDYGSPNAGATFYSRSTDGGSTFTKPKDINTFNGLDAGPRTDISADDNGNVHIAFGPDWHSSTYLGETHFRTSSNNGNTWSTQKIITKGVGLHEGEITLNCDNNGAVYLVYKKTNSSLPGSFQDIMFKSSSNKGTSWTPDSGGYHIVSNGGRGYRQFSALDVNGDIHIVFDNLTSSGIREGYYVKIDSTGKIIIPPQECTPNDGYNSIVRSLSVVGLRAYIGVDEQLKFVPPVANANGPYTIYERESVSLTSAGSVDPHPDSDLIEFMWDIDNDGKFYDASGKNPTLSWADLEVIGINDDGKYDIRLKVINTLGYSDTDASSLTVLNLEPVADAGRNITINETEDLVLDASGSYDKSPSGFIRYYEWDLDYDGIYDISTNENDKISWEYLINKYGFRDYGTSRIGLIVTDDDYASDIDEFTVTIKNIPPVADAGGPYELNEGDTINLDGSGSHDVYDSIIYAWDLDSDSDYDDSEDPEVELTLYDDAEINVSLQVFDGEDSDYDFEMVIVNNVAPDVFLSEKNLEYENTTLFLDSAAFFDPGILDTHTAVINWGDGLEEHIEVQQGEGSGSVSGYHTYENATNNYTLTLRVTDDDGGVGEASVDVFIEYIPPVKPPPKEPEVQPPEDGNLTNVTSEKPEEPPTDEEEPQDEEPPPDNTGADPAEKSDVGSNTSWLWILIVIAVLIIAFILIIGVYRRKMKGAERMMNQPYMPPPQVPTPKAAPAMQQPAAVTAIAPSAISTQAPMMEPTAVAASVPQVQASTVPVPQVPAPEPPKMIPPVKDTPPLALPAPPEESEEAEKEEDKKDLKNVIDKNKELFKSLEELAKLKEEGAISEAEFEARKLELFK